MRKILVSVLGTLLTFCVAAQLASNSVVTTSNGTIFFYQYKPPNYNNTDLFPLIISLHGVGQAGNINGSEIANVLGDGLPLQLSQGAQLLFTFGGKTEGFLLLAPQTQRQADNAPNVNDWATFYVDEMVTYGINHLRADPNRIFLTGFSAGGYGVWKYATSSPTAAAKLAGITPGSSAGGGTTYCNIASQQTAVWAFHGGADGIVPGQTDHANASAVNACNPIVPAVDTIYSNESHNIYNSVDYNLTNASHYPNVFQWMLKVNRTLDPNTNKAPIPVIKGAPVFTLKAPVNYRMLPVLDGSGSTDPDDIIMDYLWEQLPGTGSAVLLPADGTTEKIRQFPTLTLPLSASQIGVPAGTYNFRLRVKDYLTSRIINGVNHTQFANVQINITLPASGHAGPAVDAGDDVVLAPTQTVQTRSGSAQAIYGGTVNSYNWRFIDGPKTPVLRNFQNTANYGGGDNNVAFTGMDAVGTYRFEFSAGTNNVGDFGFDTMSITRLAALPVEYSYFNGQNAGSKNVISWATTSEVNSARFDIMRSADGVNFSSIGTVTAKGGASLTTYTFDDNNAPPALNYYRLSQVDKDGHSVLSKTISINNRKTGFYIEKYPNPAHDNLTVTVQGTTVGTLQVVVADMQGKTILQQQWQKDAALLKKAINISALQKGVYQMIVTVGQEKQVSSFVKY